MSTIALYARALRVHHWTKNLLVLAPAVFAGKWHDASFLGYLGLGFMAFSLVASAVYVLNDLRDIESDRAHPVKMHRVIASGEVPMVTAYFLAVGCGMTGLLIASFLSWQVFGLLCVYVISNILYSFWLKRMAIWELLVVTGFYLLRIMVGGVLADVKLSTWLILTTFFLALFLVVIKRRQELLRGKTTRKVLEMYNKEFLDLSLVVALTSTMLFYTLYTTTKSELFVWSLFFVVYGLLRYTYLALVETQGEEPDILMLTDKGIWFALAGWSAFVLIYLYY